ncbi:MAG: hypothetical protein BGO29_06800 [Bacteroidales bacterium 36-12]|nr:MAG: hypothetical protein BGO29_06800 [Bacteroidales bacterium 36-12]
MQIQCPNTACNARMIVQDKLVNNPATNIKCPICKQTFKPYEIISQTKNVGVLVVVDEQDKEIDKYNIKVGKQLVGRYNETSPCEIMIKSEDKFIHRNHFYIFAQIENGVAEFYLESHPSAVKGNGTFLEIDYSDRGGYSQQHRLTLDERIKLKSGSRIIAGKTKFSIRTM